MREARQQLARGPAALAASSSQEGYCVGQNVSLVLSTSAHSLKAASESRLSSQGNPEARRHWPFLDGSSVAKEGHLNLLPFQKGIVLCKRRSPFVEIMAGKASSGAL